MTVPQQAGATGCDAVEALEDEPAAESVSKADERLPLPGDERLLTWQFASDGRLIVSLGGRVVTPWRGGGVTSAGPAVT
ncbi:MAG: hypothetical protein SYR96_13220 [Actinomycetota bacterium]|nr:hypothetical protein [Actinomycetota bacterium]